jgi:hypothetical protein
MSIKFKYDQSGKLILEAEEKKEKKSSESGAGNINKDTKVVNDTTMNKLDVDIDNVNPSYPFFRTGEIAKDIDKSSIKMIFNRAMNNWINVKNILKKDPNPSIRNGATIILKFLVDFAKLNKSIGDSGSILVTKAVNDEVAKKFQAVRELVGQDENTKATLTKELMQHTEKVIAYIDKNADLSEYERHMKMGEDFGRFIKNIATGKISPKDAMNRLKQGFNNVFPLNPLKIIEHVNESKTTSERIDKFKKEYEAESKVVEGDIKLLEKGGAVNKEILSKINGALTSLNKLFAIAKTSDKAKDENQATTMISKFEDINDPSKYTSLNAIKNPDIKRMVEDAIKSYPSIKGEFEKLKNKGNASQKDESVNTFKNFYQTYLVEAGETERLKPGVDASPEALERAPLEKGTTGVAKKKQEAPKTQETKSSTIQSNLNQVAKEAINTLRTKIKTGNLENFPRPDKVLDAIKIQLMGKYQLTDEILAAEEDIKAAANPKTTQDVVKKGIRIGSNIWKDINRK